ncbi:MAG: restriction endonuclease subunit S, partial [Lentisphaeria bacterium]|nr:restriction endonuclease subunit S [Lentisphaeria bacterium]
MSNWDYKTLDQMGTVQRGRSKHRPRNDSRLFGGKYPFIQTADVKNAPFYISEYSTTYNDAGLAQSKLWDAGTLCITIADNIADT